MTIPRVYDEARNWGRGALDPAERAAAVAICASSLATFPGRDRAWMDACVLLDMCGLIRPGGTP